MPGPPPRIVVVGDVMTDVVAALTGPIAHGSDVAARIVERGGGAAANVAVWLARTGAAVTLIGRVGSDGAGDSAVRALLEEGVDARLQVDPHRPTGRCIVLVEPGGERTMLPDAGANAGLEEATLPAGTRHVHVAGYALLHPGSRAAARGMLARARHAGVPFSVDPSSAAPLAGIGAEQFLAWVEGAALLLPNRDEAAVLAGSEDPEAAARALSSRVGEVVVKLGAGGALWSDGHAVVRRSAKPVAAEADTTGAGDAFAAGLLAARIGGAGRADALEAGCALAARAVARPGAR